MVKDIKVVIKVSEEIYNKIREGGFWLDSGLQLSDAYDAIKNGEPYRERPIGHWIKDCDSCDCTNCYNSGARFTRTDCSGRCSNCGELQCCTDNFCPNCGADMRGKEE